MPVCGAQCWLCDLPIRFDTYKGCSHRCSYCFAQKTRDNAEIKPDESPSALRSFIAGKRDATTRWADWPIPVRIGGMSDPLQPIERKYGRTLECLKILAETGYPYTICSKGALLGDGEYLDPISRSRGMVQISAACPAYDALEPGAAPFYKRIEIMRDASRSARRLVVRIQPYLHSHREEILESLALFKEAGAHGVILEGMKWSKPGSGLVKLGGGWTYPLPVIREDLIRIRDEAHRLGLRFYAGENRLRTMGDSLTCCGTDGLEGFRPNVYNLSHLINGDVTEPTPAMLEPGSGGAFVTVMGRTADSINWTQEQSFAYLMSEYARKRRSNVLSTFGKETR